MAAISLKKGGIPFSSPQIPTGRSQNYGNFGPINKCLEALILDTRFRYLLALNGRNFGINAHLAANPTPHRRLKGGPKSEGGMI
jgi:hypothetical protein